MSLKLRFNGIYVLLQFEHVSLLELWVICGSMQHSKDSFSKIEYSKMLNCLSATKYYKIKSKSKYHDFILNMSDLFFP